MFKIGTKVRIKDPDPKLMLRDQIGFVRDYPGINRTYDCWVSFPEADPRTTDPFGGCLFNYEELEEVKEDVNETILGD